MDESVIVTLVDSKKGEYQFSKGILSKHFEYFRDLFNGSFSDSDNLTFDIVSSLPLTTEETADELFGNYLPNRLAQEDYRGRVKKIPRYGTVRDYGCTFSRLAEIEALAEYYGLNLQPWVDELLLDAVFYGSLECGKTYSELGAVLKIYTDLAQLPSRKKIEGLCAPAVETLWPKVFVHLSRIDFEQERWMKSPPETFWDAYCDYVQTQTGMKAWQNLTRRAQIRLRLQMSRDSPQRCLSKKMSATICLLAQVLFTAKNFDHLDYLKNFMSHYKDFYGNVYKGKCCPNTSCLEAVLSDMESLELWMFYCTWRNPTKSYGTTKFHCMPEYRAVEIEIINRQAAILESLRAHTHNVRHEDRLTEEFNSFIEKLMLQSAVLRPESKRSPSAINLIKWANFRTPPSE